MVDKNKYNMSYRPETYFEFKNWKDDVFSHVARAKRRKYLEHRIEVLGIETYEEFVNMVIDGVIDPRLTRNQTGDEKMALAGTHPMLMGGEYLPDFEPLQVEIARASLESVLADVISVRARYADGLYPFDIVDEYGTKFEYEPKTSDEPLTMEEIIQLIDSVDDEVPGWEWVGPGLNRNYRNSNVYRKKYNDMGIPAERLINFTSISSAFYPELSDYYDDDSQDWLEEALEWAWEDDPILFSEMKKINLSKDLLEWCDLTKCWDRHKLGERFDFFSDVVEQCENIRVYYSGRADQKVHAESNDEDALLIQIRQDLARLIWQNRSPKKSQASRLREVAR